MIMMKSFLDRALRVFRLYKETFKDYRWQIVVLALIGFLSGALEGIGANALIPLFSFITGEQGESDSISEIIRRFFDFINVDFSLAHILVFIALLFVAKAIILFWGSYIQFKISYDYEKNTRSELFKRVLESSWGYLLEQKMGYLEKVLSVEIQMVARLLRTLSSLVLICTGLFMYISVAINIFPSITFITLGVGIATLILFQPLIRLIKKISGEFSGASRMVAHFINENIAGMKTVKTMSVISPVLALGDNHFTLLRDLEMRRSFFGMIFGSFFQPLGVIFILLLFTFSYKTGTFSLPAFVAIVYLIQRIFSHVQNLQTHLQTVFSSLPYVEHVLACRNSAVFNREENKGAYSFLFNKDFSFKNVSFNYRGKDVLSDVSFSVPKGSFVGLIGPSGAGKTTIVDLLLRLFDPVFGEICVDGISISDFELHEYRKNVGYVSQDIHLINDTIASNIRFFDASITKPDIIHASRQANIYDFIESLPEKFDTVVGERGIRLSAGQRQRIIIARILARNPQLLILDEATSALDNESERKIQDVIEGLKGKVTIFVIAHRLGTIINCDTVFVLDNGAIAEQGKPHDLLKNKKSYFFKMYNLQK